MALESPNTPIFYKINRPVRYDSSTIGTEIVTLATTDAQTTTTLNAAKDLVFDYRGTSSLVLVNSFRSGFRMKFKFKTKSGNPLADLATADTTLCNNFWAHLFSDFSLKVGSTDVETIPNFGIVYDARTALESDTFAHYGSIAGYIPDEKTGATDDPGYEKRKGFYNYTPPGADAAARNAEFRHVEIFVPLRSMSGFCDSFNRLTTNLSYRFTLRRNGTTADAYFGAANTGMTLQMTSIQLELETFDPSAGLKAEYLGVIEKTKELDLAVTVFTSVMNAGITTTRSTFSESQFSQARTLILCAKDTTIKSSATANYGIYTHADISDVTHDIQTRKYPNQQQEANFGQNTFMAFYRDTVDTAMKVHGTCGLSALAFKNLYPFLAVDVSAQEPAPNNKPLNIKTTIRRHSATPANVDIYLVICYERHFKINMQRDTLTQA